MKSPLNDIKDVLIYDSGCATTIFNDKKWFLSLEELEQPMTSLASNGMMTESRMGGKASFEVRLQAGNTATIVLGRAVYQPSSPCNLISSSYLRNNGVRWDQDNDTLYHKETGTLLMELYNFNGVPAIKNVVPKPKAMPTMATVPYRKMHRRLMHAGKATVEEACRRAGIQLTRKNDDLCEGCIVGKKTDEIGKEAPVQGDEPLDFIRVDTVSHRVPGHLGYKYSIHIIDVASNYHWVKFVKEKTEVLTALQDWVEMIHT